MGSVDDSESASSDKVEAGLGFTTGRSGDSVERGRGFGRGFGFGVSSSPASDVMLSGRRPSLNVRVGRLLGCGLLSIIQ